MECIASGRRIELRISGCQLEGDPEGHYVVLKGSRIDWAFRYRRTEEVLSCPRVWCVLLAGAEYVFNSDIYPGKEFVLRDKGKFLFVQRELRVSPGSWENQLFKVMKTMIK